MLGPLEWCWRYPAYSSSPTPELSLWMTVPVVGVPSASQSPGADKPAARYNLFEIDGEPGAWSLTQRERGLHETLSGIGWVRERDLLNDGRAVDARPRSDARPAHGPVTPMDEIEEAQ